MNEALQTKIYGQMGIRGRRLTDEDSRSNICGRRFADENFRTKIPGRRFADQELRINIYDDEYLAIWLFVYTKFADTEVCEAKFCGYQEMRDEEMRRRRNAYTKICGRENTDEKNARQ